MRKTSSKRCGRSLAVTVALTTTLFAASTAEAAKVIVSGVTVLDPASTVPDEAPGRTIAAWTADWWRWAWGQSRPKDAFTDTTGEFASIGQSGPVFFLAGANTSDSRATRTVNVPANAYLLVPLVNNESSQLENPLDPPRPPLTQAELLEQSAFIIGKVDDLVAKVDGMSVADLAGLRAYLEHLDSITFEAAGDNPFAGGYEGSSRLAVADGYSLMLAPIGFATHTIEYGGRASAFGFSTLVTATVTGVPEPAYLALLAAGLMGPANLGRHGELHSQDRQYMQGADPGFHPAAEKVVFGGKHFLEFPRAIQEGGCPDSGGEDCGFRAAADLRIRFLATGSQGALLPYAAPDAALFRGAAPQGLRTSSDGSGTPPRY